jgi:hypothetical protein
VAADEDSIRQSLPPTCGPHPLHAGVGLTHPFDLLVARPVDDHDHLVRVLLGDEVEHFVEEPDRLVDHRAAGRR